MTKRKDSQPLLKREVAIVTLPRGTMLRLGGMPLELLADDTEFKTAAENVRWLGSGAKVIDQRTEVVK